MKMILNLVLLGVAWNYANAAFVAPKTCHDSYHGKFNIGKTELTKQCGVAICKEDGTLDIDICPAISVAAGSIIIPEDLSKPHPQCCERVIKAEDVVPCFHEGFGNFSFGKTALKDQCGVVNCKEDGTLDFDLCPAVSVAPGSIIVPEDLSKPHPQCCERVIKAEDAIPCTHERLGTFNFGKTVLKDCGIVNCKEHGQIEVDVCPLILVPVGYTSELDLSKPFPECCYRAVKLPSV